MLIVDDEFQDIDTLKGKMRVSICRPKGPGRFPAIIWYSEIFQITGPIKRSAQILASHGFVVAIPEVYHEFMSAGAALNYTPTDSALGNQYKTDKSPESWQSDAEAVVAMLQSYEHCTGKIGVSGVCLGGGLAFSAAVNVAGIDALVAWYPTDLHKDMHKEALAKAAAGGLKCEALLFFGRQDPHIPGEGRRAIYDALTAGGANFQWCEVNGQHAFLRDENSFGRYDAELAAISYDWAVKVFARLLR